MELLQREASVAAVAVAAEDEDEGEGEGEGWPEIQSKVDALMLLRIRDHMKQQLMEFSTAVHAGQEGFFDHITKQTFTKRDTQDLKQDMEKIIVSFQNKTLAFKRVELLVALKNKMEQNDNESRLILETMKHIAMLSNSILEHQQQARENEEKLNDIKRKRLSLKKAGRQKLLQIHNMTKNQKEKQVSEMLQKIHARLQKERQMTTVIQHVFQNIIIASRVNWSEDSSLKAVVLQLEKNTHFQ